MKYLLVNKFLYPNGGSETYIFELGKMLESHGHQVQYFGMNHENNIVGNEAGAYTSNMDFHKVSGLKKLSYSLKTIYSNEARKKIRKVLDNFKPDVCHLNNFNYQLTPSIILEIKKWSKKNNHPCKIVYTAHDLQLVCPNHLMQIPDTKKSCTKCLNGCYINCTLNKCIHNSFFKSVIGSIEAYYWNLRKVYKHFDLVICPSRFIADKLATKPYFVDKICVLHNFINAEPVSYPEKKDYVLYYGRYSEEKGIVTLLNAIDELKNVNFVFAGDGPLRKEIEKRSNIINKGFLSGDELSETIASAKFVVVPSECFENCPFTVMESITYHTPVIGADIGGIPELIINNFNGELFESGNALELKNKIDLLYNDEEKLRQYIDNCGDTHFDTIPMYYEKLKGYLNEL